MPDVARILATEFESEIPNLAQLDAAIKQLPLYANDDDDGS